MDVVERARLLMVALVLLCGAPVKGDCQDAGKLMETYPERLVRVEKLAPGFGGMFTDEDGRLVIYLLDTSTADKAKAAIEVVFGASLVPAKGIRALQGQYTVTQLKRWLERATRLMEHPGVHVVALDEASNRIAIGIYAESRREAVNRRLRALGIPQQAVVVQIRDAIAPVAPARTTPKRRDKVRP
jgi:hypothetical protein